MRTTFALAALAGAVLAIPYYGQEGYGNHEVIQTHLIVETVVETIYVTEAYDATTTTSAVYTPPATTTTVVYEVPTSSSAAPVVPTSTYVAPAYPTSEAPSYVAPTPEPQPTPTPSPTPSPAPAPQNSYMDIINKWRVKMGKSTLTWSATLEANALKTVTDSHGSMVHELNPGSYGQVLAPGGADDFEHVFVGGWLCEVPSTPGLDGVCDQQSSGWDYEGQTGHNDICTNDGYHECGCALNFGIWGCDFA